MCFSKENFVLFTPMLHEVAGSDVGVTDIVQPLRKMLRHTRVAIADVEAIDLARKQVRIRHPDLPDPYEVTYDQVVLALGAVTNFFTRPARGARVDDEDSGRRHPCAQPCHRLTRIRGQSARRNPRVRPR